MRRYLIIFTIAVAAFLVGLSGGAAGREAEETTDLPLSTAMKPGAKTRAPVGHVRFCRQHPEECKVKAAGSREADLVRVAYDVAAKVSEDTSAMTAELNEDSTPPVVMDDATWEDLKAVNALINRQIRSVSDRRLHGRLDVWSIGTRAGDCEDYALTKRRALMEKGWPSHALLITTARDGADRPHAVLVARTDRGDFVLDNLTPSVSAWTSLPYRWIKQQSAADPRKWQRLGGYREEMIARKRERLKRLARR